MNLKYLISFFSFFLFPFSYAVTIDVDKLAETYQCYAGGYDYKAGLVHERYQFSDFMAENPICRTNFENKQNGPNFLSAHSKIINFQCAEECPEVVELLNKYKTNSNKVIEYVEKVDDQRLEFVFKNTSTRDADNTDVKVVNKKNDIKGTQIRSIALANLAVLCGVSNTAIKINPLFKLKSALLELANPMVGCREGYHSSGITSTGNNNEKILWIEDNYLKGVTAVGFQGTPSCFPFKFKATLDGRVVVDKTYSSEAELPSDFRKTFPVTNVPEQAKIRFDKTYLCPSGVQPHTNAFFECGDEGNKCGEDIEKLMAIINSGIENARGVMTHNWMQSKCYNSHYSLTVGELLSYSNLSRPHETNMCDDKDCPKERESKKSKFGVITFGQQGKIEQFQPSQSSIKEEKAVTSMLNSLQLKTGNVKNTSKNNSNFLSDKGWFNNTGEDNSNSGNKKNIENVKYENGKNRNLISDSIKGAEDSSGPEGLNGNNDTSILEKEANRAKTGNMGNIEYILKSRVGNSSSIDMKKESRSGVKKEGRNFEKGRKHFLMFKQKYCKKNSEIPALFSDISQRYCLTAYPVMLKD